MENYSNEELQYRTQIARELIEDKVDAVDLQLEPDVQSLPAMASLTADLRIPFSDGLAPIPKPFANTPGVNAPIPKADVLAITWTVDEQDAMCDVLTPGFGRKAWYRYRHLFETDRYRGKIREGAPSLAANRLGSWFLTEIGGKRVVCFKSELHLNQDGVRTGDGTATLPVKDLFLQLIEESEAKVVLTVGTAGGTYVEHDLGDVVLTRGAKFRLQSEFKNEPYARAAYRSDWQIPMRHFAEALSLMQISKPHLVEPPDIRPTQRYPALTSIPVNDPDVKLEGRDYDHFHPILSTDFFEFGTSKNRLDREGCGLEMGDAALGLACQELQNPPAWAVIRNLSDPQINGDLPDGPSRELNLQAAWAVYYYRRYGYWTSVNSALTTWAIAAGL